MSQIEFKALAEEALTTFAEIADGASQKLASMGSSSANSFASWQYPDRWAGLSEPE